MESIQGGLSHAFGEQQQQFLAVARIAVESCHEWSSIDWTLLVKDCTVVAPAKLAYQ